MIAIRDRRKSGLIEAELKLLNVAFLSHIYVVGLVLSLKKYTFVFPLATVLNNPSPIPSCGLQVWSRKRLGTSRWFWLSRLTQHNPSKHPTSSIHSVGNRAIHGFV
jgi:hypothetical protein